MVAPNAGETENANKAQKGVAQQNGATQLGRSEVFMDDS